MKIDEYLEKQRQEALKEHEFVLRSHKPDHGPGTVHMAQAAMVAEICAAHLGTYVLESYSVLSDPELFRLAMIASDAVDELNSAMQDKLRP